MGLSLRNLCTQLSALHLDGCYRITDRTVLEVLYTIIVKTQGCGNSKIFYLSRDK